MFANLLKKAYALFAERRQTTTSKMSSKNRNRFQNKFSEAAVCRYFLLDIFSLVCLVFILEIIPKTIR